MLNLVRVGAILNCHVLNYLLRATDCLDSDTVGVYPTVVLSDRDKILLTPIATAHLTTVFINRWSVKLADDS